MIDTVLFDLDGTLLPFLQEDFIAAYFGRLKDVFPDLGLDPDRAIKAVWIGTGAMLKNDGSVYNAQRFWAAFADATGLSDEALRDVENACDRFYAGAFDGVKSVLRPFDRDLPQRLVRGLAARGFTVALATNPLFPACAVTTRLGWIGLTPQDFSLVTDYSNSTFCKPNPDYYREILGKLKRKPDQCLMVGNNTRDDMRAGALGIETFLVTDCLENEDGVDIAAFRTGTLADVALYLDALSAPNGTM